MTKIQTVFWNKGVSAKAIQLLKLGKNIDGSYRGIQPLPANFSMGTNPRIEKFVLINTEVDLIAFLSSPIGERESFRGFKLLITNDESENFYLQLDYRVIIWQLLDSSEELRDAMEVQTLPKSPRLLGLNTLVHSTRAVRLFKDLEYNINSFVILHELAMPLKGTTREVGGKWDKIHSPAKWTA